MKIIKNFLDENLIEKIELYAKESPKKLWYTNSFWDENIVKNSGLVSILPLNIFEQIIKNKFIIHDKKFERFSFIVQYYKWHRGSYIPFHNDDHHDIGSTLYLNKNWDIEDGGLFVYEENNNSDNLRCISPEFNTLIINDSHENHHVSLINYHAKTLRKTIQIWIDENVHTSKKNSFSYQ